MDSGRSRWTIPAILLLAGVLYPAASQTFAEVWQNMPLIALLNGYYPGNISVAQAGRHGNFGLGAFADLDGEMIADRGKIYRIRASGSVDRPPLDTPLSFAAMITFHGSQPMHLPEGVSMADLEKKLHLQTPDPNAAYAVRITGLFAAITTRAPRKQSRPFVPFCEVIKDQVTFPLQRIRGTMAGYLAPGYLSSFESPGYHLHFIADDLVHGGHVLDFQTADVTAQVQRIDGFEVEMPRDPLFTQVNLDRVTSCSP